MFLLHLVHILKTVRDPRAEPSPVRRADGDDDLVRSRAVAIWKLAVMKCEGRGMPQRTSYRPNWKCKAAVRD